MVPQVEEDANCCLGPGREHRAEQRRATAKEFLVSIRHTDTSCSFLCITNYGRYAPVSKAPEDIYLTS